MFCKYSEIFGKVGEGIHSYRIFNIAIVDVIGMMIGAHFVQKYYFTEYTYCEVLLGAFLLGIIFHRLFCVRTTIDKLLFK